MISSGAHQMLQICPDYTDLIESLPEFDKPSFFGLPENIDRSAQRIISLQIIGQLRVLQRADVKGTKFDREVWNTELGPILNLWKKLNTGSQLLQQKIQAPSEKESRAAPVTAFVLLERYNAVRLVQFVHQSLSALSKVIRGTQLITADVAKLAEALLQGETPINWLGQWDGPEDPILYLRGLVARATAMQTWVEGAESGSLLDGVLDLAELFHPDTFLNALRQQTAREVGCSMDELIFACSWKSSMSQARHPVRLGGLQLEGASFDGSQLTENSADSPSVSSVPKVTVAWLPKQSQPVYRAEECISLPVYYDQYRDRIVTKLDLPCSNGSQDQWVQSGAALFLKQQ